MTLEEKLDRLEEIVGKLEEGGLPLEDALKLFEEGVRLAGEVKEELAGARARIQEVIKKAEGVFELRDFEL
jgi:exodeoxyribonuclease VII small subunit